MNSLCFATIPLVRFKNHEKRKEIRKLKKDITPAAYRTELKYLCTEADLALVENRIQELCEPDPYVGEDGIYRIRSVYFDDYEDTCFYENENGTDPREKFRIRIYNENLSRITLELKKKRNGKNHKDNCPLSKEQLEAILQGDFSKSDIVQENLSEAQLTLLNKFYLQYQMRLLRPKVIVAYERTPFIYRLGNVRITFDRNISASCDVRNFADSDLQLKPIMPTGKHILEVKYDEMLPNYIHNALQIGSLQRTTFSKYYLCRKYS